MKRFLLLALSLALSVSFSQELSLSEALAAAESRTAVVNARLAQADAQLAFGRTQLDPLALRLEFTQAEQRALLTQAELTQARYQARADISAAYTQLLEAQAQLELAGLARDIAEQNLSITQIRFERGSATLLDVQETENALEDARNTLRSAQQGVGLALTSLASLIPQPFELALPVPDASLPELPPLDEVRANLSNLPALLQVQQAADLAAISLDLLDPSYASQSQLDNARLQAEQAAESAAEAKRALDIQAQALYNTASSAAETLEIRRDALANAREREALERQRLDAGLIAEINLKQAQLATQQAEIAALQAEHAYLNAMLDLQAGTMTALGGNLAQGPAAESAPEEDADE